MAAAAQSVPEIGFDERPARASRHIPALDGLRGVAILLVVLHNAPFFPGSPRGLLWLGALLGTVGWIGVQLFFVLSGFLITRQLLDSQGSSNYYRAFYARRTLRIFPLYYAALFIGLVIFPLAFPGASDGGVSRRDQIWLWIFLSNWALPLGAAHFGLSHFWSLAIEEQFYLIWPFVVRRANPRALVRLCTWIAVAALLIRAALRSAGANPDMLYAFTVCRMDALAIGAGVAALLRLPGFEARAGLVARASLPAALALALIGALVTRAYTRDLASTQTIGFSVLAVSFGLILLAGISPGNRRLQTLLCQPLLRSVGKYSFGMYVVHYPIILGLAKLLPRFEAFFGDLAILPFVAAVILLSYAAAYLSYHAWEKPFLRMKRRFVPTRIRGPSFATLPAA